MFMKGLSDRFIEPPIEVIQYINAPRSEVWEALTNREKMVEWYFDNIPDFKAELDFYTEFNVHNEGRDFLHQWTVREVVPEKLISYDWKFKEYEGLGLVRFELFDESAGTMLKLSNYGIETFPSEIPEFTRESCQGGWEYFINGRLKAYFDS